jgi:dTDP-4-amino-4,6-dideoxygalactose transaminase
MPYTATLTEFLPFVDLAAAHRELASELDEVLKRMLENGDFILGHEVAAFELEFARYCEVDHAIGLDSGLSALELALRAFGVGPGDEVITQANTFIATAFAITHVGATPVLVDVDATTGQMDVEQVEQAITSRTRALMPVHLHGLPAEMDGLVEIARRNGLVVIEDACQAHGARYRGRRAGSIGDAAAFSFYPSKNLGAAGDGGAVTTNDPEVAATIRMLRNYGQRAKYDHVAVGYNRRLDTLHAGLLRVKLRHLDEWNSRRQACAAEYQRLLDDLPLQTPYEAPHLEHVWHVYQIRVEDRDGLAARLNEQRISTSVHYPIPIHLQDAYRGLGHGIGDFPVSEDDARRTISLPMHPHLDAAGVSRVAETVRAELLGSGRRPRRFQRSRPASSQTAGLASTREDVQG